MTNRFNGAEIPWNYIRKGDGGAEGFSLNKCRNSFFLSSLIHHSAVSPIMDATLLSEVLTASLNKPQLITFRNPRVSQFCKQL
jgi:hypothetical protein